MDWLVVGNNGMAVWAPNGGLKGDLRLRCAWRYGWSVEAALSDWRE